MKLNPWICGRGTAENDESKDRYCSSKLIILLPAAVLNFFGEIEG